MSDKNRNALLLVGPILIALVLVFVIYDPFHILSDNPERTGTGFVHVPVWLWFVGVGILGAVMAYGISQGRRRTRSEANATQNATGELYRSEESSRRTQRLP